MAEGDTRTVVAIATYQERDNLEALARAIHQAAPAADILIIDDNSPDGTGVLADQLAQADPRIHVIHRAGKLGLGTAILAGMRFAIDRGYDRHVTMDADFSHDPRYLPALLAGMKDHDLMIGSRYVPGGGVENWPLSRRLMSGGVNLLVRLLMRLPARDCSGGFRCYAVSLLRRAAMDTLLSHGYSFQEEMLFRCHQAGAHVGETPILFVNRREGTSKVNVKEVARSLGFLLYLGLRTLFGLEREPGSD